MSEPNCQISRYLIVRSNFKISSRGSAKLTFFEIFLSHSTHTLYLEIDSTLNQVHRFLTHSLLPVNHSSSSRSMQFYCYLSTTQKTRIFINAVVRISDLMVTASLKKPKVNIINVTCQVIPVTHTAGCGLFLRRQFSTLLCKITEIFVVQKYISRSAKLNINLDLVLWLSMHKNIFPFPVYAFLAYADGVNIP